MTKLKKCLNCGNEFKVKGGKNFLYCSVKCYWEYHLKHFVKEKK